MNLEQFLIQAKKPESILSQHVICFKDNEQEYPLLFFSLLGKQLKQIDINVETINLVSESDALIQSKLQTSFLGQKVFYWMKNFEDLDEKKRKLWIAFGQNYQGPNVIGFFISNQTPVLFKNDHLVIDLASAIDQRTFTQCLSFFGSRPAAGTAPVVT